MLDVDAAWLAAAVDGEGSISIREKPWPQIQVIVVNTDIAFLQKAANLMGSKVGVSDRYQQGVPRKKVLYRCCTKGHAKSLAVLEAILPYLIIKRGKAEHCIAYIKNRNWGSWGSEEAKKRHSDSMRARWAERPEEERIAIGHAISEGRRRAKLARDSI